MYRIAPLLAYSYGFRVATLDFMETFEQARLQLKENKFGLLDYCHHISAGQKAFYTKFAYDGIETLRLCCGGAGFSAWSGLPQHVLDYSPNVTFEGDNTLLALQASRFLVKTMKKLMKGKPAEGPLAYLNNIQTLLKAKCTATTPDHFLDIDLL